MKSNFILISPTHVMKTEKESKPLHGVYKLGNKLLKLYTHHN